MNNQQKSFKLQPVFLTSSPRNSHTTAQNKSHSQTPRSVPNHQNDLDDDEQLIQRLLDGELISEYDPVVFARVISRLRAERDALISSNRVDASEEMNSKYMKMQQIQTQSIKTSLQNTRKRELEARLVQVNEDFDRLKKITKVLDNCMIDEMNEQLEELATRQNEEVTSLTEEWRSPTKMRLYNRASQQLRSLRIQQTKLLNSRRFDEMREIEKEADILEKKETDAMQYRLLVGYKESLEKLETKHNYELSHLQDVQRSRWNSYEDAKKFDFGVMKKRIKKVEGAIEYAQNPENVFRNSVRTSSFLPQQQNSQSQTQGLSQSQTLSTSAAFLNSERPKSAATVYRKKVINQNDFNTLKLSPVPPPQTVRREFRRTAANLHF